MPELRPATAVPAADALVRAGPLVVVLSEDLALLQSMDEARFAGHFIGVASLERFVDQLVSGDVAVAVVDCSLVPEPTGEFMLRLHDQFPCLALIAAGDSTEQSCISGLIADGTICRFVHKPASSQRLGLFLEAGLRRHAALLNNQLTLSQTMPALVAGSPRPMPWTALFIAAVLAVALFFYWQYNERSSVAGEPETAVVDTQPATATDTDGPVATPIVREPIAPLTKLLDQARRRMDDGALLEPTGDNARQYIDEAHGLAPDDPQVHAAAMRLGELIIAAARRAIAAGKSDEARRWLSAASNYHVNPTTLDWLREQVQALESPATAAPVKPPAATSAPSTTNAAPSTTKTAPPATTTAPPATTVAPPASTSEPQITTTAPSATTTAPPATTTAPPATATAPPAPTSEPQSTTTAPPSTTIALPAASDKPSVAPADRAELESN